MKMRILLSLALLLAYSCAFVRPLPAGEETQAVIVYSDRHGDAGWIEKTRSGDRMQATPYFHVSGKTVRQATDAAGSSATLRGAEPPMTRNPSASSPTGTSRQHKEAIAALLSGPNGMSLGGVLDLAHQASDSARESLRNLRNGYRASPQSEASR